MANLMRKGNSFPQKFLTNVSNLNPACISLDKKYAQICNLSNLL